MSEEISKKYPGAFIDESAEIADDVKIYPNVYILGNSKIGKGTVIYPNTTIENSVIGEDCEIKSSYIEESVVKNNVKMGPFAHLRPHSVVSDDCKIGNFVEIKNAVIGKGTAASHLAYVGDADIGENCNIGCGAIFVNYNGKDKNRTVVEDNCFIGSNTVLIAPIKIGKGSKVAAGSTLNQDVKPDSLAIARTRQITKENYYKNEII
jgi:bifunctional UDP-N-acetylglucosamine pyrophosphorylase/glucosamine-1-phosphate N-acetyltransferase